MTVSILVTNSTDNELLHGPSSTMSQDLQATKAVDDDPSDYGDFTLDEQEVINELLAILEPANLATDELLKLTDIEDYEEPTGIRLPKTLGKELRVAPWIQQQPRAQVAVDVTVADQALRDSSTVTNRTFISFEGWYVR
jgi:hypothetical protein